MENIEKIEAIPAIKVVDDFFEAIIQISDEEIEEAVDRISRLDATYGILWGLNRFTGNDDKNIELYLLKREALYFMAKIREDKRFKIFRLAVAMRKQ